MIANLNLLGHQSFQGVKLIRKHVLGMDFLEVISAVYKESSVDEIAKKDDQCGNYIETKRTSLLMDEKIEGLFSYNSIYSITNIQQKENFDKEKVEVDDDLPF